MTIKTIETKNNIENIVSIINNFITDISKDVLVLSSTNNMDDKRISVAVEYLKNARIPYLNYRLISNYNYVELTIVKN